MEHYGRPVTPRARYTVAAPGFLAEGGDLYTAFAETVPIRNAGSVVNVVAGLIASVETVTTPQRGRQMPVSR